MMVRREFFAVAPATALAASTLGATPEAIGGLRPIVDEWKEGFHAQGVAAMKPGGRRFDSPECLAWQEVMDRCEALIRAAELPSHEDFKAFLEFLWTDNSFGDRAARETPAWDVQIWHIEKLLAATGADMAEAAYT